MGLVLALVMTLVITLVASGSPGTAAERNPRSKAGPHAQKVSGPAGCSPLEGRPGQDPETGRAASRAPRRAVQELQRPGPGCPAGAVLPRRGRPHGGAVSRRMGRRLDRARSAPRVRPAAGWAVAEHPLRPDRAAQLGDQRPLLGLRPGPGQRPVAALLLRRGGRSRPGRALHRRRHGHRPDGGLRPRRAAAGLPEAGGVPAGVRQDQAARPQHAQGRSHRPRLLQGQARAPVPALPHPGHAVLDPPGRAARQRPSGGPRAQHRAGAPRRRDREPDDGASRAPVRADHLRGRVRRVQLQDHLPSLREAHRLVEGEAAGAGRQQEEWALRLRRCRRGPRSQRRAAAVLPRLDLPRARGQLPGRAQLRPREPLRRAALAVRGRTAVHQPAVTADQCLRRADPAAAAASAHRDADPDAHRPDHDDPAEAER